MRDIFKSLLKVVYDLRFDICYEKAMPNIIYRKTLRLKGHYSIALANHIDIGVLKVLFT